MKKMKYLIIGMSMFLFGVIFSVIAVIINCEFSTIVVMHELYFSFIGLFILVPIIIKNGITFNRQNNFYDLLKKVNYKYNISCKVLIYIAIGFTSLYILIGPLEGEILFYFSIINLIFYLGLFIVMKFDYRQMNTESKFIIKKTKKGKVIISINNNTLLYDNEEINIDEIISVEVVNDKKSVKLYFKDSDCVDDILKNQINIFENIIESKKDLFVVLIIKTINIQFSLMYIKISLENCLKIVNSICLMHSNSECENLDSLQI